MPEPTRHLLLVEDESALRAAVAEQLADRGYHVKQADSGESAVAQLADFAFDVIITDLRLPGMDGSAVVEAAVERYPDIIAIVITGYGTVKDAVEAIKRGARDFVSKLALRSLLITVRQISQNRFAILRCKGRTPARHFINLAIPLLTSETLLLHHVFVMTGETRGLIAIRICFLRWRGRSRRGRVLGDGDGYRLRDVP